MESRFIFVNSKRGLNCSAKEFVENLEEHCDKGPFVSHDAHKQLFAAVDASVTCQLQDSVQWMSYTEFQNFQPNELDRSVDCDLNILADNLHHLADSLPSCGVRIHVLWFGEDVWPEIEQSLELYGALKRLSIWNNANIILLHTYDDDIEQSAGSSWANILMAPFIKLDQFQQDYALPLWYGSMKIYGPEINQPVTLPGFSIRKLKSVFPKYQWIVNDQRPDVTSRFDDVIVDSSMQFLTSVYIRDIPSLYITSHTYQIDVTGYGSKLSKSKTFLSPLIENPQLGYLVRLSHGTQWKHRADKSSKKSTHNQPKQWSDSLVENIINVQECTHNIELCGETGFYHFLLCGGQGYDGSHVIKAHLMRTPNEINGDIVRVLADLETKYICDETPVKKGDMTRIEACIDHLPHYKAETFLTLETNIQEAQINTLQMWTESCKNENKEAVITGGDLLYLLSATRRQYMAKYREKYGDPSIKYPEHTRKKLVLSKHVPEYKNPEELLERKILVYQHNVQEKMKRNKSNDSLGGLSPPVQGHVLKLNASELLKFFNSDGTAKDCDLEPIQIKKSRMRKYDSGEMRTAEWPQCSHYKFHDVYYNVGQTPEKTAQKTARIAERMKSNETLSTCTQQQTDNPASIKITKTRKRKTSCSTPRKTPKSRKTRKRTPSSTDRGRKRTHSNTTPKQQQNSNDKRARKRQRPSAASSPSNDIKLPVLRERLSNKPAEVNTKALQNEKVAKYVGRTTAANKERESRSARHKKKLEDTIKQTLADNSVRERDGELYRRCYEKLYKLTYTQVKTLKTYTSLRSEMQKIASEHVEMVVMFEQSKLAKSKPV